MRFLCLRLFMYLLIDSGNTFIKWAFASAKAAVGSWTSFGETAHSNFLSLESSWPKSDLKHILISNVAGPNAKETIATLLKRVAPTISPFWFSSQKTLGGITNHYKKADQLGCDRFAALIGAHWLFPNQNLVVANCGTATTIDTVLADGSFIGGMIVPGLRLMANALSSHTAQLPAIQLTATIDPFATDTQSAIQNGCITAQVGAIEHAVGIHAKPYVPVLCVLSGGAAKLIAPSLSIPAQIVDNLVLTGLHAIAKTHIDGSC